MTKECPHGPKCAIHNRVSYSHADGNSITLVDYWGDYAVLTDGFDGEYSTFVHYVGKDAIGDMEDLTVDEVRRKVRFYAMYDSYRQTFGTHRMVWIAVLNGIIDLSEHVEG